MTPDAIMVFAAGFGTRMGVLTKACPKPLIPVQGKPLIDHALGLAVDAGMANIVVNSHYLADQLQTHLAMRSGVTLIEEKPDILETGGGLRNALPLLGAGPVFTLNSDMIWTGDNPLTTLRNAWKPAQMDALLLLIPRQNAQENTGQGDFFMNGAGQLQRRGIHKTAPFVYSGTQIIKTDLFYNFPQTKFSLNLVWDQMMVKGRVFGVVHNGGWVDVGRPEGIAVAEAELQRNGNV